MYTKLVNIMAMNPLQGLPSGYRQVEYIECDARGTAGIAYLIADYYLNANSIIDAVFSSKYMSDNNDMLYGTDRGNEAYSTSSNKFMIKNQNNSVHFSTAGYVEQTKLHLYQDASYPYNYNLENTLTGTTETLRATALPNATSKLYLFTLQRAYTIAHCREFRLYKFTIREFGEKVLDLIPCVRISDNKASMYDIVNNVYLEPQGSGYFKYA